MLCLYGGYILGGSGEVNNKTITSYFRLHGQKGFLCKDDIEAETQMMMTDTKIWGNCSRQTTCTKGPGGKQRWLSQKPREGLCIR